METKLTRQEIDRMLSDKSLPEKLRKDLESKKNALVNDKMINK
jgi:hypothetical protein